MSDLIAGRIELLDPLARGASGSLWRAVDRRYGAICAAKVMRQRDGADVLRFVREQTVGSAQGLGAHPHLLPPYTWVAEDDTIVLVMPLVHGGTLAEAIAGHGALSPALLAHLLRQLLDALAAMHDSSWVHRDVKPANLLLDATGDRAPRLLLADFGIALHVTDIRLTATGLVHGTPGFMAPEVLEGVTSAPSQDVWAAAACALEALAPLPRGERPPPQALTARVFPALAASTDPAAAILADLLPRMLSSDPEERPSAAQARDRLVPPAGAPGTWARACDGRRFTVSDRIEPLTPGTLGAGLPEVPLSGPEQLAGLAPGLHERITARSDGPGASGRSETGTTRVNPGAAMAEPPPMPPPVPRGMPTATTAQVRPRRGLWPGVVLLVIAALCLVGAGLLASAALAGEATANAAPAPSGMCYCPTRTSPDS